MEAINFNDFSPRERDEIITAFLIKMRQANSLDSAQSFFDYYVRKFYKLPMKLMNDIVYCQRTMRTILMVHRTIVSVFGQQDDANETIKKNYLTELEDDLFQLNAECQYLVIRLQNDVDRFCSPFVEQRLQPNENLIKQIISGAIVPLVVAPHLFIKPFFVAERPTESQLLNKYIINGTPELNKGPPKKIAAPVAIQKKALAAVAVAVPVPPPPSDSNVIKESRMKLHAALKRARSQQKKVVIENLVEEFKEQQHDDKIYQTKEYFMQSVSLCTHMEHKRLKLEQTIIYKRKPKMNAKLK